MPEPESCVDLAEGIRLCRDEQGSIRVTAEAWSPPLDDANLRDRIEARLSECRAALELTEDSLGVPDLRERTKNELLDRYSVLLNQRRILEDYLVLGE